MPTHKLTLEVHKRTSRIPQQVVVRQGEAGTQAIEAEIVDDGSAYTSSLPSVRLDIMRADGRWARVTATKSGSKTKCTLPSEALSSPGLCRLAHFVFFSGTTKAETTEGFELRILPAVDTSDPEEAAEYYDDMLTKLYEKWEAYEKQAESQEAARVSAENARKANETDRQEAEETRQSQEAARVTAEKNRVTEFNTLKSQSQAATTAAQIAASNANSAANYAQTVADGLSQSVIGDEDVAAMKAQIDKLGSMIANATGKFFYMDGTIYAPSSKASVSGSTIKLADTCSVSGTTINLA